MVNEIVRALAQCSTCDISDALLKLKVPHGGFLAGLTMWSPQRQEGPTKIVGPAYTVKYVRTNYANEPKPDRHYIDTIPSGSIVFVSAPPRTANAVFGGLMSRRAKYSGAVGAIVDGRIRDLHEHRGLEFPVFARDVGTAPPYEVVRVSEINTPVRLQSEDQDTTIHPGDYLIGDINGVVCIPASLAPQVVKLTGSQCAADERIMRDLDQGKTFADASKEHRSSVLQPEDL